MDNVRLIIALPLAVALYVVLTLVAVVLVIAFCAAYVFHAEKAVHQMAVDVGAAGGSIVRYILRGRKG